MDRGETSQFSEMLGDDVRAAMGRRAQSDSQLARRDVVRTTWAANEGLIWVLREHVTDCADMTYGLEAQETAALAETIYNVSSNGKISSQTRFVPLLDMFRLIGRIAARIEPDAAIDFGTMGWQSLVISQKVRNRITHPKSRQDLHLTDDDMFAAGLGFFWLVEQVVGCMEKMNIATRDYLGQFDEVLERLKAGDPEMTKLYEKMADKAEGTTTD